MSNNLNQAFLETRGKKQFKQTTKLCSFIDSRKIYVSFKTVDKIQSDK